MSAEDSFADLARYYDPIMAHVDYDRWLMTTTSIAAVLPEPFIHLDAACGTCTLLTELLKCKWNSVGVDLSVSMLKKGRTKKPKPRVFAGDLCRPPAVNTFDYVTCLFDSVNFFLQKKAMRRAIKGLARTLKPGGILYFDIVTERMILDYFADQQWTERNGRFSSTWDCTYHRATNTAETRIRINRGPCITLYERVYDEEVIEHAIADAGLQLLGRFDAETWRRPTKRTVRIDYVCTKGDPSAYAKSFKKVATQVRKNLA